MSEEADKEVEARELQKRARLGIVVLIGRTAALMLATLAGKVYLARVLGPAEFGAFWLVQHVLSFFVLFGDAGLGAALVQKKTQPTESELSTVFWTQLAIAIGLVGLAWFSAPIVLKFWPDMPEATKWLMRALAFEMVLTSLRIIPAILMERELRYARLSAIDLIGSILFYVIASFLARRYGTYALVAAVLVSGVLGTFVGFAMRPWWPRFTYDRSAVRRLLGFGVAYQAKNVVGFLNAAIIPVYGGSRLGRYNFGLVSWAQNIAYFPLQLGEIVSRVNFPLFSRLQHFPRLVAALLARALLASALVTYLFIAIFCGLGPGFVGVIYGDAWLPATPMLYVFSSALSIGFLVPLAASALDALGRPQVMMRLGLFWTSLNWVVVLGAMQWRRTPFVFSIAYAVHIVIGNAVTVYFLRDLLDLRPVARRLAIALLACGTGVLVGQGLLRPWITGPFSLSAGVVVVGAVFVGVVLLLDRQVVPDIVRAFKPERDAELTAELPKDPPSPAPEPDAGAEIG